MEILKQNPWFYSNGLYVILGIVTVLILMVTTSKIKAALKEKQLFDVISKGLLSLILVFGIGLNFHKSFLNPDVTYEAKITDHKELHREGYEIVELVSGNVYVIKERH